MTAKNKIDIINFFKIARPYQWIKNILVFVPMIMSHNINLYSFTESAIGFIILSLIASSVYIINDIVDIESDKQHPYKKYRPLAADLISINQCKIIIFFLVTVSILLSLNSNIKFLFLILIYFFISNLYSFILKKLKIFDLLTLAILYTLRIIGGGLITDIYVSSWLLSFSFFFFLSLASIKRKIELNNAKKLNNKSILGRGYSIKDLKIINIFSILSAIISIIIFILYLNSSQVKNLYSSPEILWIICLILSYWIFRIFLVSNKNQINDDPIIFAIYDIKSYICAILILMILWFGTFL